MLVATGIDVVSVKRVEELLERYGERFLKKILPEGWDYCLKKRRGEFAGCIASRFALKEAAIKACSAAGREVSFGAVEVRGGGKSLSLKVKGCEEFSFLFSVSHEREFAAAVVNLWLERADRT